jgi:ribonucleoside-triphosphate reductase
MAKMVKLTKAQLKAKVDFISEYMKSGNAASSSSFDPNANVSQKNIATLSAEIHKDFNIQTNRAIISTRIKELYGETLSEEYIRMIEEHEIYIHDETSLMPYCVSITMYPFLIEGTKALGGHSDAPKHLESFCGEFLNLIFSIAAQFAGAVSTPEFLMYFDHFARLDLGDDYLNEFGDFISDKFQQVIYTLNEPAAARNYQSVFWNIALFDEYYFDSMFGDFAFPDGDRPNWNSVSALQEFYLKWINEERTKKILTFPVTTANILSDGVNAPKDTEFATMLTEELSQGNSFFIYMSDTVDSLSSCCRLRNEFTDNTFSYTLGAGGVATGSINVITMNINRIVQRGIDLKEVVEKVHKFQIAYRSIIEDYLSANLLTVYTAGFIQLDKQYLTLGVNGLSESAEFFDLEVGNNSDYIGYIQGTLKTIYDSNREAAKETGYKFNTEMVPGENLGVKNAKWDKKDGLVVNRQCYNSYFYLPESNDINIIDKFILHGRDCTGYLDGGSALHLNLGIYLTPSGYMQLFKLMAKTGCNYLGTNTLITLCKEEECGAISKSTFSACPKCKSTNITHATRVIGFLKEIGTFSEARQEESGFRFYH